MPTQDDRLQIGEFSRLVGLSVPQLRRYDRLQLLMPEGRSASGYRWYSGRQISSGRVIALLRSVDMPIEDVRRVLAGVSDEDRQLLFAQHRDRLEVRLDDARRLLEAIDQLARSGATADADDGAVDGAVDGAGRNPEPDPPSWLHVIPRIPVTDIDRATAYYQRSLGLRVAWQTVDRELTALASGPIELALLVPWLGPGPVPRQSLYIYIDDPDALCAEYEQAGAIIVDPVASRSSGMRDFAVVDPDGHRFTLGCGEEALRDVADHYGLDPDEIAVNPEWLERRR